MGLLFPREVPNGRRCGIHPPVYIELSDVLLVFSHSAPSSLQDICSHPRSLSLHSAVLDDGIKKSLPTTPDGHTPIQITGHLRADANRPESCDTLTKADVGDGDDARAFASNKTRGGILDLLQLTTK